MRAGCLGFILTGPAAAYPDAPPWDTDCTTCHFSEPPVQDSAALTLTGIKSPVHPGRTYRLTLSLKAPGRALAGFRIKAESCGDPAGRFAALDERVSADRGQARSNLAGAVPTGQGIAVWHMTWQAPVATTACPVRFELRANAGNDDASPGGDVVHMKTVTHPWAGD